MYPNKSNSYQLKKAKKNAYQRIRRRMTDKEWQRFIRLRKSKRTSLDSSKYKKNYTHDYIAHVASNFNDQRSINPKDPDLYVVAGTPGSGKTSLMTKYIKEPTTHIDTDAYRELLSHYHKSPMKRFNLVHSSYLHPESQKVTKKAINRALREKRNVILDVTMNNKKKTMKIIRRFRNSGYDIHLLGTQMYPHNAISSTTNRFLSEQNKVKRYVSPSQVATEGNNINNNVWFSRNNNIFDSIRIKDSNGIVTDDRVKEIYRRGKINKNYRNPKEK